ncbi:hypothetical protein FA15DRAFT_652226 [Coprinopsis marcescibilis]|uniref:FIST domain-containing protein n=1 Tax=Coprinopsis marcescibilis TaxID=230819 RepID=A0A5C3L8P0_COPMA|nr:hypothetical protein FA15DRAFT_652226 [Coprinopsis marcescibilis]
MPIRLTTLLSRNHALIEQHVLNIAKTYSGNDLVCMFALSASDSVDWTKTWRHLRLINETDTVGCISSPFQGVGSPITHQHLPNDLSNLLSCSIGVFDKNEATVFRSRIAGDRQPQVGRWHAFRKQPEDEVVWNDSIGFTREQSWEDIWKQGQDATAVPLDELKNLQQDDVSAFVYFTDRANQGLSRSLSRFYPGATKLGLFAPSTLTVNERPATMLYRDTMVSEGAVGLALKKPSTYPASLDFQGAHPISDGMEVTISQGNMIESLNSSNPTQQLLDALERVPEDGISSSSSSMHRFLNKRVFLGVQDATTNEITRMHHISAGDPSRGPLSIVTETAPPVGSIVKFFLCPSSSALSISPPPTHPNKSSIQFITVPEVLESIGTDVNDESIHVLNNVFLAASDAGLAYHAPHHSSESVGTGGPVGTRASLACN